MKNKFILLALSFFLVCQLVFSRNAMNLQGKTYAVILNGGKSLDGNKENYWNDCSFFYAMLREVYNVPKENIKVLMSDGTDPSVDMKLDGNENLYVSSPLDLDGDGVDDIEYSATKDNLKKVFADLSNMITVSDHLLVFVVDHGSINNAGISQICLWGDSISAPELSDMVKPIDAGYMTFVLGQCYAGGFEKYLSNDNRLILAACREYEKSYCREEELYDEFVYQFTSALAGHTPYDEPVDADYNGDGTVSIVEAYRYAEENDGYNDGDFAFGSVREHPSISYLEGSNAEDLSLSYVPSPVELVFAENDAGSDNAFWNSGAVSFGDGNSAADWQNANSDFSGSEDKTMTVRVRNRGVRPYASGDKTVSLYWSEAMYVSDGGVWSGDAQIADDKAGGLFQAKQLDGEIKPGAELSLRLGRIFSADELRLIKKNNAGLNYIAFLHDAKENPLSSAAVNQYGSNVAQKSVQAIGYGDDKTVVLPNLSDDLKKYTLRFTAADDESAQLFSAAELSLVSDGVRSYGKSYSGAEESKTDSRALRLLHDGAEINGIMMPPYDDYPTVLSCSFNADRAVADTTEYRLDMSVVDESTGKTVGGESFVARRLPRKAIELSAVHSVLNGKSCLVLTDSSEPVECQWLDAGGNLLGTGQTYGADKILSSGEYTLRARSLSDGAVAYKTVSVGDEANRKSLSLDRMRSCVSIVFKNPVTDDIDVIVSTSRSTLTYRLEKGKRQYSLHYDSDGTVSQMVTVVFVVNGVKGEAYKLK